MFSSTALLFLVLLSLLPPSVVCLTCYKCVAPSISPLTCYPFSMTCAAGERCMSTTATAIKDTERLVLKEKSCATPSQCGISGEKRFAGLVFKYTTRCCDTDLCNAAGLPGAPCWGRTTLSLTATVLAVLLTSV